MNETKQQYPVPVRVPQRSAREDLLNCTDMFGSYNHKQILDMDIKTSHLNSGKVENTQPLLFKDMFHV